MLSQYGERALVARPGLIVGPHDQTERFSYWPRRFTRGGPILAPGDPTDPVQWVDVRDLAAFLVGSTASGVFNAVGPTLPMADLLDACRAATGSDQEVTGCPRRNCSPRASTRGWACPCGSPIPPGVRPTWSTAAGPARPA